MTIAPIVTSAVAILAPYFAKAGEGAAKKAGEETWEKIKTLYQVISNKLSADKDDYAQQTLKRLEEKSSDKSRQRALSDILTEKAETDTVFAQELQQLVQGTTQGQDVGQFLIQLYGGEVGKIVNIGQVIGDVSV